ncbi:MAG TPA: UbiA family prenyltransferase [Alphaproteobacteria bacterium]|nr:UbiA family prenyltransferase [Alphaproteobacteria bacterium]
MNSIVTDDDVNGFAGDQPEALLAALRAIHAKGRDPKDASTMLGPSAAPLVDAVPPAAGKRDIALEGDRPLVVDVDGTLIKSDLLLESLLALLSTKPRAVLGAVAVLPRGRAAIKAYIAREAALRVETLPLNAELIAILRKERAKGRKIYLASGSDRRYVEALSQHLRLFDGVFASDGKSNLSGKAKAMALCEAFGEGGFDYAGNARPDREVWERAHDVLMVNTTWGLRRRLRRRFPEAQEMGSRRLRLMDYVRACRVHQWLKNLLILIPALAAHQIDPVSALTLLVAFLSFSTFASGSYLINDLLDLGNDRQHPVKRSRPFASGAIPLSHGPLFVAALLATACALAHYLPSTFTALLLGYGVLTLTYSLWLKRKMMVDVLMLACLYGMRLVAGGVAVAVPLSPWLVAFSIFLFLSLAIIKRCTELIACFESGRGDPSGRGYQLRDLPVLEAMAAASGYVAVMVFAFYINSPAVMVLYHSPERLWLICVILIYWIGRMVVLTHRGRMHTDPIVFAATDRVSLVSAAAVAAVVVAASV